MARFKKGSKEAKAYMAKIRSGKSLGKTCNHKICGICGGVKKNKKVGSLLSEKCSAKCLAAQKDACECKCEGRYHKGKNGAELDKKLNREKVSVKQATLFGIGYFDTSVIKDLDDLKKQYFKLAKVYHPDTGGTKEQFQKLQNDYEKLLKQILSGSSFSASEKENETVLDAEIRSVIDQLVTIEGITIELIGKWLWIGGNTYPVRVALKSAGLTFIKKAGVPYWVYKGVESKSRGKMEMDEIRKKYGTAKYDTKTIKKISSVSGIGKISGIKLKRSLQKLMKALDKRPI